ncbi:hypothetical protein RUND412_008543, partial [Rhizina undulata]
NFNYLELQGRWYSADAGRSEFVVADLCHAFRCGEIVHEEKDSEGIFSGRRLADFCCDGVNWGLGKHSSDVPTISDITTVLKIGYAGRSFYIFAAGLTKISVLVFLARINPYNSISLCIKALIIATSAYIVIGTLCEVLQCIPISHAFILANLQAIEQTDSGCMDLNALEWSIPIIWHVRATLRQKLAMVAVMCLGLTACISSVIWIYSLAQLKATTDTTWFVVELDIWISAEISTTIFCSCCPLLKMLFMHHFRKSTSEIHQTPPEGAMNLDHIPRPPRIYGHSSGTSPNERMDDFMYDASQDLERSTTSLQLRSLPDLESFKDSSDKSCGISNAENDYRDEGI